MRIGISSVGSARATARSRPRLIRAGRRGRPQNGFTLLEVLVVITLMAVIASLAAPLLTRAVGGVEARTSARDVAATLRAVRSRAIIENRDLAMAVDVDEHQYWTDGRDPKSLPERVRLRIYGARSEQLDEATSAIRFFPDGSSTGGEVILEDARIAYHVQVEWLTGQVAIVEGPPER